MKKLLISALVAALIAFVFQALSWMALPIHKHSLKYTPKQDEILAALEGLEDGYYMVPYFDPDNTTMEEQQALQLEMAGKPWALINYNEAWRTSMGKNMGFGFLLNLVAALLAAFVLSLAVDKVNGFFGRWFVVLCFALFAIFQPVLAMANWWSMPAHYLTGDVLDLLIAWGLAGSWMAHYQRPR